jgi:glutamate formiminotransferase
VRTLVECVANFSEGRDAGVVDSLCEAISRGAGAAVLHRTSDADHNRTVITFAGTPEGVAAAAVRAAGKAVELIDLNRHSGVHPRLGAVDVIPFVPVEGITLAQCAKLARQVGQEIWREHKVPVYFYEAAALRAERQRLENVRRGGFEAIRTAAVSDPARAPDVGGPELHPTAGAAIVGARKFLIAWNVNLAGTDLEAAREIARTVRESSGGLPAVKALGLRLASRDQVQVSVNLTDFELTPLHRVFEAVATEAARRGLPIAGTEIIGLIPRAAIEAAAEACLRFENFTPSVVLEQRIDDVLPPGLDDLLEQLADPARSTGGAAAAAMAGAMAAALGEMIARRMERDCESLRAHRRFFLAASHGDDEAYASPRPLSETCLDALVAATEVRIAIAERAHRLSEELAAMAEGMPDRFLSDMHSAVLLVRAARQGGVAAAKMHIVRIRQEIIRRDLEQRISTLQ